MHVTMFQRGDLVMFYAMVFELTLPILAPPDGKPVHKEVAIRAVLLDIDCSAGIATVRTMDGMKHAIPARDIYKLPPGVTTVR